MFILSCSHTNRWRLRRCYHEDGSPHGAAFLILALHSADSSSQYLVALLWYQALAFLVPCLPTTLLFTYISFSPSGVLSTQTRPPPAQPAPTTPGLSDFDFAPASSKPAMESQTRGTLEDVEKSAGRLWKAKRPGDAGSVMARYSASVRGEKGTRIPLQDAGSWSSGSRSASGSGTGSGSAGTGNVVGGAEGRWEGRPSQWAQQTKDEQTRT